MRLFTAAIFDTDAVDRLARLRDELSAGASRGSFTKRENLHLTLEFLGEMDQGGAGAVWRALSSIEFPPITLVFDHVGEFRRSDGGIWWAAPKRNGALLKLQGDLRRALVDEGIKVDGKKYRPHVTLARRADPPLATTSIDPIRAEVVQIALFLSELRPGGAVYTVLGARKPG